MFWLRGPHHHSTEHYPTSPGGHQDVFFFLWRMWFATLPRCHFSYCGIMNTDHSWDKWSPLDVRLGSLMTSWMCLWSAYGGILVARPPGKVHRCFKFCPLVDNGLRRPTLVSHWAYATLPDNSLMSSTMMDLQMQTFQSSQDFNSVAAIDVYRCRLCF